MPVSPSALTQEPFKGWPAHVLRQADITLSLVPGVGGRLMGMRLGEHELCFVHPQLEGQTFTGDQTRWPALCGDWDFPLWGGGKTWVAPESAWPQGAPHRDLDSLAWTVTETWCDAGSMGVTLQSPVCSVSGLQIERRLSWPIGSREWTITHTLRNAGQQTLSCGLWDVLMLQRPATVRLALAPTDTATRPGVTALPGKLPVATLVSEGLLELDDNLARVHCNVAREFKCGFASERGQVQVDFADWNARYTRHSAVDLSLAHAHGHPLEVFNAPRLNYFEIETHSPLQTLHPGDCIHHAIHERVDPLTACA